MGCWNSGRISQDISLSLRSRAREIKLCTRMWQFPLSLSCSVQHSHSCLGYLFTILLLGGERGSDWHLREGFEQPGALNPPLGKGSPGISLLLMLYYYFLITITLRPILMVQLSDQVTHQLRWAGAEEG